MLMDPLALGAIIGLVVGTPIFTSTRLAAAVLGQVAIGVTTAIATTGFGAVSSAMEHAAHHISENPFLAVGLVIGFVISGALSAILRNGNWGGS